MLDEADTDKDGQLNFRGSVVTSWFNSVLTNTSL